MICFKKKLTFIFSVLLLACTSEKNQEINWRSMEAPYSAEDKKILLLGLPDSVLSGMVSAFPDAAILELFHLVDVNADGMTDVIYNGYGGAADEFVVIYLKDSTGWKKVLQEYGHLKKLKAGGDAEIELMRKELVGERGGDSIITFRINDFGVAGRNSRAE